MMRKVLPKEGFTFSDGMKIPYGAFLSVPSNPVHHDLGDIHMWLRTFPLSLINVKSELRPPGRLRWLPVLPRARGKQGPGRC